jgi:hypothetical protein
VIKDYRKTWRNWPERHPILLGAVITIVVGFGVLVADHVWKRHDANANVNSEIIQIGRTASDFDPIVQRYIALARANDPQARGYHDRILSDVRVSRMNDLGAKPVTQWPSIESCDAFRAYYGAAFNLLILSVDKRPIITVEEGVKAYDGKLEALQKALNAARR